MSEPDPEQETLETLRRTTSTTFLAATQAAERISRRREQDVRQAEAEGTQRSQELRQRLEAEKSTARATTAQARRPDFWANASVDDVARTYQTAAAWAERDPAIETDRRMMAAEINKRYGVDVTDVAAMATVQHQSNLDRGEANQAHDEYVAARGARDAAVAAVDPDNGTQADERAHAAAETVYDSAEARSARADARRGAGLDEAAVRSYGYADLAQAKPVSEAVTAAPESASTPTRVRGRGMTQHNAPRMGG